MITRQWIICWAGLIWRFYDTRLRLKLRYLAMYQKKKILHCKIAIILRNINIKIEKC